MQALVDRIGEYSVEPASTIGSLAEPGVWVYQDQTSSGWKGPPQCARCGIRKQSLFSALDHEAFALIGRPIEERRFARGERLYRIGDSPDYLFTVRAGLVKLTQYLPDGAQRIVRLVKPGDLIGLETLLGIPYGHDAVVLVPVLACRIPVEVVKYLDRRIPELGRQLMERWHRALTETDSWLTELATGSTQKRIARLLIHLVGDNEGRSCYLPAREDIAAMIGTATETASRVVADLKRYGAIEETQPHRAQVDIEKTRRIAGH